MIWEKYSVKTTSADIDMVCAALMDFGIVDVEIEEPGVNPELSDDNCYVNFYMEGEADAERKQLIADIDRGLRDAQEMFGLAPLTFAGEVLDSSSWENKWKEYFKPFMVDDIAIRPTWEELPAEMQEKASVIIDIDPEKSFGTGRHETTRLCIRGIRKYLKKGDAVMDIGCGSGILSICALKLGAESAVAADIDPEATATADENLQVNGIDAAGYSIFTGNIITDEALQEELAARKADIVLANILADVVEPLTKDAHRYLKHGGIYITSGIIDNKEKVIVDAVKANPELELVEVVSDGDWRSIVAKRK